MPTESEVPMSRHNYPLRSLIRNFLICGLTGWCIEIVSTALCSLRRRNLRLTGTTSLWMFPIYGCAAFLHPFIKLLKNCSVWVRGLTYMFLIFSAEFASGSLLNRKHLCPWDYGRSRYHIGRVIRLDYAPVWFCVGLLFERILTRCQNTEPSR